MSEFVMVVSSAASREQAMTLARALVTQRLAACVQTFPISSCYRWDDKTEDAEEFMLLIKTRAALYQDVEALILSLHSYKTPEILCFDISAGAPAYLGWIQSTTRPGSPTSP